MNPRIEHVTVWGCKVRVGREPLRLHTVLDLPSTPSLRLPELECTYELQYELKLAVTMARPA